MARVLVTDTHLTAIGDAIRAKSASNITYTPAEMAQAILDIPAGGANAGNEDAFITGAFNGPYINDRVEEINTKVFTSLPGLTIASFQNVKTMADGVFENSSVQDIKLNSVEAISKSAFKNNTSLLVVEAPNATVVNSEAFKGCETLMRVNLENVEKVYSSAFEDCSYIKTIDLPNANYISDEVFKNCVELTTINIPKVDRIHGYTFDGCEKLNIINLPSAESFAPNAFTNCGAKEIYAPIATELHEEAFKDSKIETVSMDRYTGPLYFDDGEYGRLFSSENLFENCVNLKYVNLPELTTIGNKMFLGCSSLESVSFPMATTMLLDCGEWGTVNSVSAFENCSALKNVNLPLLSELKENTFKNCVSLEEISLPSCKSIDYRCFYDSGLKYAYLPLITKIADYSFTGCKFEEINKNAMFPKVTDIDYYAFVRCKNLKKFIDNGSSNNVKKIGKYAFCDCSELKLVEFCGKPHLDDYIFSGCNNLKHVVFRQGFTVETYNYISGRYYSKALREINGNGYLPFQIYSTNLSNYGYVYVPRELYYNGGMYDEGVYVEIDGEKKVIAELHTRVLEDYTVDGTTTGALDLAKMGLEAN